ncbi:MAG: cytochrome c biogenesis protein CcsA [Bacteroidia bacterium]
MEIQYIGEHLIWGQLGQLFAILSFAAALLSAVSYFNAHYAGLAEKASWQKLGRLGFSLHSLGILGIIGVLFYILFNHYFEYQYVWQHSNTEMQMKYILSCFWEGQEGSFLLWSFWNAVLGNILLRTAKSWEFTTMAIVSMVQVFLASMLLGIYVGGYKIGSDPFILLREHPDFMNFPFIQQANYLDRLDGRGLNPLLQNYWMTIHPPTLFLGFSATLFPFAFAVAGIWSGKLREWIQPALPWTFFGISILGTGILMGGAWAYEALSFGGFWAWDPVENASLVPWLTFVAGGHVMLINQKKGESLITAFFLVFITFILILYSTFLTRSGVLGETSVHAFTDLGMSGQLLIYMMFFIWLPSAFAIKDNNKRNLWILSSVFITILSFFYFSKTFIAFFLLASIIIMLLALNKQLPKSKEEEHSSSREFWMFVGALVLLIAAFQITFTTSTPVINKMLSGGLSSVFAKLNEWIPSDVLAKMAEAKLAAPADPIEHYNSWQLPFAIIIALIMAVAQFLKYKKTDLGQLIRNLLIPIIASLVLTVFLGIWLEIAEPLYLLLLFASLFSVLSNFNYLVRIAKGKLPKSGTSIAHIGFGLVLCGALISAGKQEFISKNNTPVNLGEDFPREENILLALNDTLPMGDYHVSYRGDSVAGINIYYNVDYFSKTEDGSLKKVFSLSPFVQTNPRMGNVAEPATKHYIGKDIFTHVTYAPLEKEEKKAGEWKEAKDFEMQVGDTLFTSNSLVIFKGIDKEINPKNYAQLKQGDIAVGARLDVLSIDGKSRQLMPIYVIRESTVFSIDAIDEYNGIQTSFFKIDPENETFSIRLKERVDPKKEFIILKAIIFPGINILWIGCILMAIGTLLAVWSRIALYRNKNLNAN